MVSLSPSFALASYKCSVCNVSFWLCFTKRSWFSSFFFSVTTSSEIWSAPVWNLKLLEKNSHLMQLFRDCSLRLDTNYGLAPSDPVAQTESTSAPTLSIIILPSYLQPFLLCHITQCSRGGIWLVSSEWCTARGLEVPLKWHCRVLGFFFEIL